MSFQYPGVDYDLRNRVDDFGIGHNNTHWKNIGRDSERSHAMSVSADLAGCTSPILQVREVAMMIFMDKITDKESWEEKHDDKVHMPRKARILSENTFNYSIAELRNKATYFKSSKLIPTLDAGHHTVVKSDNLVGDEIHAELAAAFDKLQREALGNEDWHPGSDEVQQNFVHPSMYPLTTPLLDHIGSGSIASEYWSEKCQWLPSLVDVRNGAPKFASYINGRQHPEVYGAVEKLIDAVITAWDQCLRDTNRYTVETPARRPSTRLKRFQEADDDNESLWESCDLEEWRDIQNEPSKDTLEEIAGQLDLEDDRHGPPSQSDESEWERSRNSPRELTEDEKQLAKWLELRDLVHPEPPGFETINYEPQHASICQRLAKHGLQIIVTMASAERTPEKPEFAGGNWHMSQILRRDASALPEGCMTLDEAKEHRLALMEERTASTNKMEESWVKTEHNFCEH
ncbi:uncharacterized protein J7T54_001175 [Emericellopsis cladophorae]|uniref:Uncharacterized protein n=1 Tax=Emericellopsis cladophorae TaxID=2686198 RepID=A0A9P9XZC6_9HYPO|nr:uncharacterized protein J7T54_001175 [Emericellopsis cladophorae]KAI6780671.1 hypothetical protein J7T54_001175 [Emericellopsis cladophorae]